MTHNKGPYSKEEALLVAMDANIDELEKGDKYLPESCKKWVETAVYILTGVPQLHSINLLYSR
jgi:hypothetical protein